MKPAAAEGNVVVNVRTHDREALPSCPFRHDPPVLNRVRRLVAKAFTTRQVEALRPRAYFDRLTAARRRDPGDDLVSALATTRAGDDVLTDAELSVLAMVLVVTGHDTTTYEIGDITYTLLTHPGHLSRLRSVAGSLPRAVEELLRFIPFRQGVGIPRVALEDVEVGGVTIKAGDAVHVSYLTANRDALVYERPDELDFDREHPVPHLTFGLGSHHCLGSHLARMVIQVAVGGLLTRFPTLRLAVPARDVRWDKASIWRYPVELPVTW